MGREYVCCRVFFPKGLDTGVAPRGCRQRHLGVDVVGASWAFSTRWHKPP